MMRWPLRGRTVEACQTTALSRERQEEGGRQASERELARRGRERVESRRTSVAARV